MTADFFDDKFNLLHSYSRADALRDGELIDVSEWGSTEKGFIGGFVVPVALTRALFETIRNFPENCGEDIRGRAHDVLFMASQAARGAKDSIDSAAPFAVLMTDSQGVIATLELFVVIGPGDAGEPVVTIGFPENF